MALTRSADTPNPFPVTDCGNCSRTKEAARRCTLRLLFLLDFFGWWLRGHRLAVGVRIHALGAISVVQLTTPVRFRISSCTILLPPRRFAATN